MSIPVTDEQKALAIIAHLAYLLGGLGFLIAPLVIMLIKKEDPFIAAHAKQALVAHVAILVASMIVGLLCVFLVGFLLIPVLAVLWLMLLIASLVAAYRALNGEYYEYPLIQGLIRKF